MRWSLLALAPLLMAASPPRGFDMQAAPASPLLPVPPTPPPRAPSEAMQGYAPAPTPNRDVDAPLGPRAGDDARLSPTIINRRNQYRGEALDPTSSAQAEQERKLMPGAGFSLRMPLTPQPPRQ